MRDATMALEAGTPAAPGGVPVEGPASSEAPAAGSLPGSPIPIPPVLPRII